MLPLAYFLNRGRITIANPRLIDGLFIYIQGSTGAFLPAEMRGALYSQTLHPSPQFGIQQDAGHGALHVLDTVRMKKQSGAASDFRHGRGVGAGNRPPASHCFHNRKSEACIEGREDKTIAGVVKVLKLGIAYETGEVNSPGDAGRKGRFPHLVCIPGIFTGHNQTMVQLRVSGNKAGKGPDETDLVLPRLQIPHGKNEGSRKAEELPHGADDAIAADRAEIGISRIGNNPNLIRRDIVTAQNSFPGKVAYRQNPLRESYRASNGAAQLGTADQGKELRVFEKADVVHGDDHGRVPE